MAWSGGAWTTGQRCKQRAARRSHRARHQGLPDLFVLHMVEVKRPSGELAALQQSVTASSVGGGRVGVVRSAEGTH
jgi:hypothetical protein